MFTSFLKTGGKMNNNDNFYMPKEIILGSKSKEVDSKVFLTHIKYDGKIYSEVSFNRWRDNQIPLINYENKPISGLKIVESIDLYYYSRNHRKPKITLLDPRGFKIELNVDNVVFLLKHSKYCPINGFEEPIVYTWLTRYSKDLTALPTNTDEYKQCVEFSKVLYSGKKFKKSDMVVGKTYIVKNDKKLVYIGYDYHYDYGWNFGHKSRSKKPKFLFYLESDGNYFIRYYSTLSLIISVDESAGIQEIPERVLKNHLINDINIENPRLVYREVDYNKILDVLINLSENKDYIYFKKYHITNGKLSYEENYITIQDGTFRWGSSDYYDLNVDNIKKVFPEEMFASVRFDFINSNDYAELYPQLNFVDLIL